MQYFTDCLQMLCVSAYCWTVVWDLNGNDAAYHSVLKETLWLLSMVQKSYILLVLTNNRFIMTFFCWSLNSANHCSIDWKQKKIYNTFMSTSNSKTIIIIFKVQKGKPAFSHGCLLVGVIILHKHTLDYTPNYVQSPCASCNFSAMLCHHPVISFLDALLFCTS